jgi:hypothetical protein
MDYKLMMGGSRKKYELKDLYPYSSDYEQYYLLDVKLYSHETSQRPLG